MKTHTEHLHLADNTRKKVIIISKTKDGLGIEPHLFEAWKSKIEDAINEAISNLKANAK